jgi:hypothetical protein
MKHLLAIFLLLVAGQCYASMIPMLASRAQSEYLLYDNLEYADNTAAAAAGWNNSGTPTWGYATSPAPLGGYAASLRCTSATTIAYQTYAAQNEVWLYVLFNIPALTNDVSLLALRDSGGTNVATVTVRTTGLLRVNAGGTNGDSSTGLVVAGTTYHLWIRYVKGTGANAIITAYLSTTGTRGSSVAERTDGTQTNQVAQIRFQGAVSTAPITNKLRLKLTEIGDNPA